jgi:hypothetical protein
MVYVVLKSVSKTQNTRVSSAYPGVNTVYNVNKVDVVVDFKEVQTYFHEAIVFNRITSAFQQQANATRIHKIEHRGRQLDKHTAGVISKFLYRIAQKKAMAKLRRQQNCCKALVEGKPFHTEEKVS